MAEKNKTTGSKLTEKALQDLAQKLSATTGKEFFRSMVKDLVEILDVEIAFAGELTGKKVEMIKTLAVCEKGDIVGNFEYSLLNTPCENVVGKTICSYRKDIQDIFPKDHLLKKMEIQSYVGAPLFDSSGRALGIIVAANRKPLKNTKLAESILKLFATRTSTEMERMRIEEQLINNEKRYRTVVENQEEFIVRWKPDGTRTFVNSAYLKYFGISPQQAIGTSFMPLIAEEDQSAIRKKISRLSPDNPSETDQHRVIKPDGSIAWNQWIDRAIFDSNNRLIEIQSVGRDITKRIKAENKLKESKELYNNIVESMNDGVLVLDKNFHFLFWNGAMERISGIERKKLVGTSKKPWDVFPHLAEQGVDELMKKAMSGEIVEGRKIPYLLAQGETGFTDEIYMPLKTSEGEINGIVGIIRDITEIVINEEKIRESEEKLKQSQKMEAIGSLAGGIAHDFNNLLVAILGYSEILSEKLEGENESLKRYTAEIENAGNRAASLTRHLLAFSRKQILQPKIIDLNLLVSEINKIMTRLISEDIKKILKLNKPLSLIKADPLQIEQVIINIVVNSRDAMPKGGKLTIETGNVEFDKEYIEDHGVVNKPGLYVMLAISDTGKGMDKETQSRIFEPFFTTKEIGKGTGLGLSTAYGIVKQSGGFIWCDSKPGVGTAFKVYFPAVDEKTEFVNKDITQQKKLRGTETILLVEDDDRVGNLMSESLQMLGYTPLKTKNGREALSMAKNFQGKINLVITDMIMPGIRGDELAKQLKIIHPEIKVIYISGYSDNSIFKSVSQNGEAGFLQKPFNIDSMANKIREMLNI